MPKIIYLLCLLVALCSFIPTQSHASSTPDVEAYALSQADSGRRLSAEVGQTIVITLHENPSTGYQWGIVNQDNYALSLITSTYTPLDQKAHVPLVGVGGKRLFVFKLNHAGSTNLLLYNKRPWEDHVANTFSLDIDVK